MLNLSQVIVRMSFDAIPVELTITDDTGSGIGPDDVKQQIEAFKQAGFKAPVQWGGASRDALIGKRAVMEKGPVFLVDKKMWQYELPIKTSKGENFTWNDMSRTSFRVGDMVEIIKNDRGFMAGQVVDPNQPLPGLDTPTNPAGGDDVPF